MADFVVLDGDTAMFEPIFGEASVTVAPGTITGTGTTLKESSQTVCVVGDESSVEVKGVVYVTATHTVPGAGTITIASLGTDQESKNLNVGGKKAILVGSKFTAKFTVTAAAQTPPTASTPDPNTEYSGSGSFMTSNTLLKSN